MQSLSNLPTSTEVKTCARYGASMFRVTMSRAIRTSSASFLNCEDTATTTLAPCLHHFAKDPRAEVRCVVASEIRSCWALLRKLLTPAMSSASLFAHSLDSGSMHSTELQTQVLSVEHSVSPSVQTASASSTPDGKAPPSPETGTGGTGPGGDRSEVAYTPANSSFWNRPFTCSWVDGRSQLVTTTHTRRPSSNKLFTFSASSGFSRPPGSALDMYKTSGQAFTQAELAM
mmetsp:Transcript_52415/g.125215  ORF Transcript_52415/g.125215 Transcript_52415/m.125215 type:complete len:230 (-) Transcript_52415:764-1453(-)